jgi:hypothetical protein
MSALLFLARFVESHPLLFSEASPSFISCEFHKKKVEELQ